MRERPDPDVLLARVRSEAERERRGKLTIFFGAAPGVGKTFAMLESARLEREEGRDVVVGIVETHGRYDTGALLLGLEILPRRRIEHRGVKLEELDLDAALARRPALVLVDELAHTNAPGSRHAKRWQDVEELLGAGLDVFTTMNVQHVESLNDVVAQITQVVVRETVPDSFLERAADVRLIDLPIDGLLERLREGKVYVPELAARARESFFREGNLIALRELALRVTAQRVDAQMRRYREKHGIDRTWAASERLLVCVSPSPASERLIRGARRLAGSLHADWIAAFVETPSALRLSSDDRRRVDEHLRLAQSLGAETVTLAGERTAEAITTFARARNVTRIVVGKPTHAPWRDRLSSSFLDELVRRSGDIEIHVLRGDEGHGRRVDERAGEARRPSVEYGGAALAVTLATLVGHVAFSRDSRESAVTELADVVMIYLLGIILVSLRWGLGPSLAAAVVSILAYDFFFVTPYHTFAVSDVRHVVTFGVMFLVAMLISGLTKRVRDQAESARVRELRTASLYSLSGALARAKTTADVVRAGAKHVHDVFGARVAILLPSHERPATRDGQREPAVTALAPTMLDGDEEEGDAARWSFEPGAKEQGVAEWTWQHGRSAGHGTDTLPSANAMYLPLEGAAGRVGVIGVRREEKAPLAHDRQRDLEAFARQIAGAIERTRLAERAHQAQLRIEAEQLRNSLLSSVSHDLRTPLAVITGTASTLLDAKLDGAVRRDLTESILVEAERLNRLVRNLLDMTRLEAGAVEVRKEWQPIEEAVGAALERTGRVLGARPVTTDVPADLPLVPYDSILLQQVLVNLLENAAKYTPEDAAITIVARLVTPFGSSPSGVEITVADRGPGLVPGEEGKIFEKFYRAEKGRGGGVGLGLTICRGIIVAHGGTIAASNREGGGAAFTFTLPIDGEPPSIDAAESLRSPESVNAS